MLTKQGKTCYNAKIVALDACCSEYFLKWGNKKIHYGHMSQEMKNINDVIVIIAMNQLALQNLRLPTKQITRSSTSPITIQRKREERQK